jgi:hypothetical protein
MDAVQEDDGSARTADDIGHRQAAPLVAAAFPAQGIRDRFHATFQIRSGILQVEQQQSRDARRLARPSV